MYVKSNFDSKLITDETNARKIWHPILLYCKKEMNKYRNESLEYLAYHFKVTLKKVRFPWQNLVPEWKRLKMYVKSHFESKLIMDETNARKIWHHILLYCKKEFSNVYLLTQICFSIANSSAATECAFKTLLLSDRRAKM